MLRKTIDSREKGPRCGNINLNVAAHQLNGSILYTSVNNLVDWRGCPGRLPGRSEVDENNGKEEDMLNGKDDGSDDDERGEEGSGQVDGKMMKTVIKKPDCMYVLSPRIFANGEC